MNPEPPFSQLSLTSRICNRVLIVREGFMVQEYHLRGAACPYCGQSIPGVWWPEEGGA
jgi:hypothetical protein